MGPFNTTPWNQASGQSGSTSAGKLIYGAYRLLGVLRSGQTRSPEGMQDGLQALNDLVDAWNTERLAVYAIARTVYELAAGQTEFTLGDLEGARPARIEAATILAGGVESPIDLLTLEERIAGRAGIYNDNAWPHATLLINPAAAAGEELVLYTWQALQAFADLDTEYSLPPGYVQALKYNLAVALSPASPGTKWATDLATIDREARRSLARIKSLNTPRMLMQSDVPGTSRADYDYRRGF